MRTTKLFVLFVLRGWTQCDSLGEISTCQVYYRNEIFIDNWKFDISFSEFKLDWISVHHCAQLDFEDELIQPHTCSMNEKYPKSIEFMCTNRSIFTSYFRWSSWVLSNSIELEFQHSEKQYSISLKFITRVLELCSNPSVRLVR